MKFQRLKRQLWSRLRSGGVLLYTGIKAVRQLIVRLMNPSAKQVEAWARFFHTLSSASVIGAFTLGATHQLTAVVVVQTTLLGLIGVIFLVIGLVLLEDPQT